MSIIKAARQALAEERQKNEALAAALERANSRLEYTAMMADVELPDDGEDVADE